MKVKIKKIAVRNPDGFTIELPTLNPVISGIIAAYKETQDCFGDNGLEKVIEHSINHDKVMGGWLNEENDQYYYDSCKVFRVEEEAVKFGRENKQIAVFDLDNLKLIKL
jgi:fructokinase